MNPIKDLFLLDPEVIFLNHGSFGACPRLVFQAYQDWQARLERQPVLFLGRELDALLYKSREKLGAYLGVRADDLVYIPNATHGVNILARSLPFQPGDDILTTDHEYGACDYTWEVACRKSETNYIHQPLPFPPGAQEDIVGQFWQGVTPRTKAIYLSHITSPTAFRFPVGEICRRARQEGILTIVDGAHAPGQIPLDLSTLDVDFYFGNLHKWALAPKGAAFLYARRELQHLVEPLVVSWGYHASPESATGSQFIDYLQWTGTKDPSAALAVPDALQFMEKHNWQEVRRECHVLLRQALERIGSLTGLDPLYLLDPDDNIQMGVAPLPRIHDLTAFKTRLYNEYRIEVPLIAWNDRHLVRVSVQGYNTQADIDALIGALQALIPSA